MDDAKSERDQRLLMFSIWASAGFAVLSSVWGILSGSSMIVFDGLYSFVSIGLSVLAVLALRFSRRGADERFPWGRDAAEPFVVVIKAATLGALCAYAAVGGIVDIVNGGREVAVGSAVVYAVVATLGGLAVGLVLRRATRDGSDLVRAEAAEWVGDTLLSVGVLIGFLVAYALLLAGRADLAAYVDPVMVTLVSLAFLWVPIKLIVSRLPRSCRWPRRRTCSTSSAPASPPSRSGTHSPNLFCGHRRWEPEWTSKLTSSSVLSRRYVRSPTATPCARTLTSSSPH
jgi:cation diffusion facilitator family transporter